MEAWTQASAGEDEKRGLRFSPGAARAGGTPSSEIFLVIFASQQSQLRFIRHVRTEHDSWQRLNTNRQRTLESTRDENPVFRERPRAPGECKCEDGCAGGCDNRGSAPVPPRFTALGRQHVGRDCSSCADRGSRIRLPSNAGKRCHSGPFKSPSTMLEALCVKSRGYGGRAPVITTAGGAVQAVS